MNKVKFVLKNVRLNFVNVFEPKTSLQGKMQYSLVASTKSQDWFSDFETTIKEIAASVFPKKKFNSPLKEYNGQSWLEEGDYYINCKTFYNEAMTNNGRPPIVDAQKNPITSPNDCYSGCVANVLVTLSPYSMPGANGITCYLNAVQVIRKGARLDNSVIDAFDSVDGFTAKKEDDTTEEFEVFEELDA